MKEAEKYLKLGSNLYDCLTKQYQYKAISEEAKAIPLQYLKNAFKLLCIFFICFCLIFELICRNYERICELIICFYASTCQFFNNLYISVCKLINHLYRLIFELINHLLLKIRVIFETIN